MNLHEVLAGAAVLELQDLFALPMGLISNWLGLGHFDAVRENGAVAYLHQAVVHAFRTQQEVAQDMLQAAASLSPQNPTLLMMPFSAFGGALREWFRHADRRDLREVLQVGILGPFI